MVDHVTLFRDFECALSPSNVSISFDFIYCLEGPSNQRHWSSLYFTGDGGVDEVYLYWNTESDDERLPIDAVAAGIDGAYHITADADSSVLLTPCAPDSGAPINVIPVIRPYALGLMTSSFRIHFRNRMIEEEGWFMIRYFVSWFAMIWTLLWNQSFFSFDILSF